MNGMSLVVSKSCCPIYNNGISSKNNYGTSCKNNFGSCKIDLIPRRLSNLHLQRISAPVATKRILKHRVYPSHGGKDLTGLSYEVPVVSRAVLPYVLLGVGFVGMASGKAREVVPHLISISGGVVGFMKSNTRYCIFLGLAAVFVSEGFLGNIMRAYAVLHDRPFSCGDIIEVGYVKGQVIKMGLKTTSLLIKKNTHRAIPTYWFYGQAINNKSRATTIVPYSLLCGQDFVDKFWFPRHDMVSKIYLRIDDIKKIPLIIEDLNNMMKSTSNIYSEDPQPYCTILGMEYRCLVLNLVYNLKQVSEDEVYLAKQDVLLKAAQVIKKHGCTVGDHTGK